VNAIARVVSVIGLVGVLAGAGVGVAHATSLSSPAGDAEAAQAASIPTVPGGPNQAVGDVLGLGYEQVVRFTSDGSGVEIADPAPRGGATLGSFELTHWAVGYAPSRIAVLGATIYVATSKRPANSPIENRITAYSAAGLPGNTREFLDAERVITSLDAVNWNDTAYLALGFQTGGTLVVQDTPGLPDFQRLGAHWQAPVVATKFGTDGARRLLLAASVSLAPGLPAVIAHDVRSRTEIWSTRGNASEDPADLLSFGELGAQGTPQFAIGDSTHGHVTFHDADSGRERVSLQTGPASVVRFYENPAGDRRVAIRAERGLIGAIDAQFAWTTVAEGPAADLAWLMQGS